MAHYYPVLLNLEGRRCLVVGGNAMAAEKALSLREAGAVVTVQAQVLVDSLTQAVLEGKLEWRPRAWEPGDLEGFFLVVAAPSDRSINTQIRMEAEERRVLINALDDPPNCGFIFPSVHRQGDLIVSVSTSGTAPALAVRIREKMGAELGPAYAEFLNMAREYRDAITTQLAAFPPRRALWYRIVDSDIVSLLKRGEPDLARSLFERLLAEAGIVVETSHKQPSSQKGDADERAA